MEHFFALLFFGTLSLITFYLFSSISNWMSQNIQLKVDKHAKRVSEQSANKHKLLHAISVIHSTKNSNTLNSALIDFTQSMKYHKTHDLQFLNKDLSKLDISIGKFAKYKALKLYGLDLQKEANREYMLYIKHNSL